MYEVVRNIAQPLKLSLYLFMLAVLFYCFFFLSLPDHVFIVLNHTSTFHNLFFISFIYIFLLCSSVFCLTSFRFTFVIFSCFLLSPLLSFIDFTTNSF